MRQNVPFVLPGIIDVSQRCKTAIQKADHALQGIFGIVKLFYDNEIGKKWFDSFYAFLVKEIGEDHEFSHFLKDVIPSFKFIRNMRNCVEHPKPEQHIEVLDFKIHSANEIHPPYY